MKTRIMYDRKTLKLLKVLTIISGTIFLLGVVLLFLEVIQTALLCVACLYMGGGVLIVCGLSLLAAIPYFRRLKLYGYEIPEDRKNYENLLENVPRSNVYVDEKGVHKESLILCIVYGTAFLSCLIWNIWCYFTWIKFYDDSLIVICAILLAADLIWLLFGIISGLQINQLKFRDDVEPCDTRKVRLSIEKGLIVALILAGCTFYAKAISYNLMDYIYRSRIETDINVLCDIEDGMQYVMDRYNGDPVEAGVVNELPKEVILTDMGTPTEVFWSEVAGCIGITSFDELKGQLKLSDGDAVIRIVFEDDRIVVRHDNPLRRTDMTVEVDGTPGERPIIR